MLDTRKLALKAGAAVCRKISKNTDMQRLLFNAIRLNRTQVHDVILDDSVRFISYCLSRRDRSKSQILQDLWVCFELGEKAGGYFVEFGATNGLKNSNTWLLEKELGWTGILAEPNAVWHEDLIANRSAHIEHRCVSTKSHEFVSFITTNETDPELSAIAAFSQADHFAEMRKKSKSVQVETISLDDLLDHYQAPLEIDYLSVDTEGSEFEILSSYSFRHCFQTISVEHNPSTEGKIQNLLESKGYHRVFRHLSQWDGWYISNDLASRELRPIVAPTA